MLGAVIGDIIGSVHEGTATKSTDFPLFTAKSSFTDDTVLSVALAESILTGTAYVDRLHEYTKIYPGRGYGGFFSEWVRSGSREPYNSWGNGSAMRVSPVGFAFDDLDEALVEARRSAEVTHNHPEGIKGAQATVTAIVLARKRVAVGEIRREIEVRFGYDLGRSIDEIRPSYRFDESCHGSVPQAIRASLEGVSYEASVRLAVSLGGDADTQACIAGGIAEARFGIPGEIREEGLARLDPKLTSVIARFRAKYCP
jgi:ADP-ribosylglycohydrolase